MAQKNFERLNPIRLREIIARKGEFVTSREVLSYAVQLDSDAAKLAKENHGEGVPASDVLAMAEELLSAYMEYRHPVSQATKEALVAKKEALAAKKGASVNA